MGRRLLLAHVQICHLPRRDPVAGQQRGDVYKRQPQLKPGQYYFSMANLLKNKNFPWVLRAAGAKPDAVFAIAGGGSLAAEAERLGLADLPNVLYLGYVSDGAAKALMAHCKAFLFPTLYEGFGIPPLEACLLYTSRRSASRCRRCR